MKLCAKRGIVFFRELLVSLLPHFHISRAKQRMHSNKKNKWKYFLTVLTVAALICTPIVLFIYHQKQSLDDNALTISDYEQRKMRFDQS